MVSYAMESGAKHMQSGSVGGGILLHTQLHVECGVSNVSLGGYNLQQLL